MEDNEVMAIEMRLTLPALRILLDSIETTLKIGPAVTPKISWPSWPCATCCKQPF